MTQLFCVVAHQPVGKSLIFTSDPTSTVLLWAAVQLLAAHALVNACVRLAPLWATRPDSHRVRWRDESIKKQIAPHSVPGVDEHRRTCLVAGIREENQRDDPPSKAKERV